MNIKILTYNICHGMDYTDAKSPDFKRDWLNINLDKTAKVVENSGADIVGLNEIYNSGDGLLEKQPKVIADKAGYGYHAFGLALSSSANREYGNALISKYKILETETFKVLAPVGSERRQNENLYYEDRAVLRSVIDVNGVKISVYVTHFGLNLLEQERMVNTLLNCFEKETYPHILIGDFNAEPTNAVLKPIFNKMQSVAKLLNNEQKTFSTYNEESQIDYVFISKEFTAKEYKRIESNVSDHYPCYAELILNI